MQIIKAGFDVFDPFSEESITKKIERVARVCYKSEDKICEGSDKRMVGALVKSKHYAMLEHGSIIMLTDSVGYADFMEILEYVRDETGETTHIRHTTDNYSGRFIISGNCRAWREFFDVCRTYGFMLSESMVNIFKQEKYAPIFDDLTPYIDVFNKKYYRYTELHISQLTVKEWFVHMDLSVKFVVDRGVSHEIVRHRKASFAQESTRYCNYGSTGGEITVIQPCYLHLEGETSVESWGVRYGAWVKACEVAEKAYLTMIEDGATPQEARAVLPNSLKTEVVMTANINEWRHFLKLRALGTTGKPHPQMQEVAIPLLEALKDKIFVVFDDLEAK